MKVIYIAGPYRAANHWLIEQNIHRARELGARIAQLGAAPLIPHANTAHWDGLCPDEFWLEAGLEMLRRCDGLALVDGWQHSSGTIAELREAERLGLPVYNPKCDELEQWLKELNAGISQWTCPACGVTNEAVRGFQRCSCGEPRGWSSSFNSGPDA